MSKKNEMTTLLAGCGRKPHRRLRSAAFFLMLVVGYEILVALYSFDLSDLPGTEKDKQSASYSAPHHLHPVAASERRSIDVSNDDLSISEFKQEFHSCRNTSAPKSVILMSLGRSGSESTFQIISNLTGFETLGDEITGVNAVASKAFFEQVDNRGQWMLDYLCKRQARFPHAGMVGFKWKPHEEASIQNEKAKAALMLLSQSSSIRLIRSRRNDLDRYLSQLKHKPGMRRMLPPHCKVGDTICVQKHARRPLKVPDLEKLYKTLSDAKAGEDQIDRFLKEEQVPHISVTYDRLYYPSTPEEGAAEWNSILEALDSGRRVRWEDVQRSMGFTETTTSRFHDDIISNFDEVYRVLKGTDLEGLLRVHVHYKKNVI
jgi:hypothetical protein